MPGVRRPARRRSRSGRAVEGDAQDLAAAISRRPAVRGASARRLGGRAVDGRRDRGVDLGQAQAAAGQGAHGAPRPAGTRGRAGCPRSRSGRSRRGASRRPSRAGARRCRRCSRGSARCRWSAAGQGVAGPAERLGAGPGASGASWVIGAAPRPRPSRHCRAGRDGTPGSGRPTNRSCRVRPPRDRDRP